MRPTGSSSIATAFVLFTLSLTINELVSIVEDIAGISLERKHDLHAPQGVRGRNSDNTLFREKHGWEPSISLREGLERTYEWIFGQLQKTAAAV